MDGLCLFALFVDREDQAAIQQLLVQLDRRGRQEDHDRPFNAILMGHETPGGRVFAGRCDGQHAFAL